jgi:EpsD family peptidyl-prolyl cis-trans isomerase
MLVSGTSFTLRALYGTLGHPAVPILAVCLLAACNGSKPGATTQVAAKVNREEISLHQVNYFLQRQAGLSPDDVDAAGRQTLDTLIDQEVAIQAAIEQRIDRDPMVVQAIEAARRELIARAYAERLAQGVQEPSLAEVKQYYDSRPALFAKRRLYSVVDTAVVATPAQQKLIQAQLPGTRSANEVAALLRQAELRFGTRHSTLGAEALPLQAVEAIAALREGQSLLVGGPRDAHIFTIVDSEPAPLTVEQARSAIEGFLTGERKRQVVQEQIKTLRSAARIEYRGRFAELAQVTGQQQASPAPAATPALNAVSLRASASAPSLK